MHAAAAASASVSQVGHNWHVLQSRQTLLEKSSVLASSQRALADANAAVAASAAASQVGQSTCFVAC